MELTLGGLKLRNASVEAFSTKLGFAFLTSSRRALITFISSIFSTVPFSHVAMMKRLPSPSGVTVSI